MSGSLGPMLRSVRNVLLFLLGCLMAASGVRAQEPITPDSEIDLGLTVSAVSDYRFRGISQSDNHPALQASLNIADSSGVYLNGWLSTIAANQGADLEMQLATGYTANVGKIAIDTWCAYYVYPGVQRSSYGEMFVHVSRKIGEVEFGTVLAYAPRQRNTGHVDNVYAGVEWAIPLAHLPVLINGSAGFEDGAFAQKKRDWSIGIASTSTALNLAISYVDTARAQAANNGKASFVISLSKSF